MNIAFYTGVSGMIAHQQELDTVSHNIANVNTDGYKGMRTSFSDLLYTQMNINPKQQKAADPNAAADDLNAQAAADQLTVPLTGHGVRAADSDLVFTQGAPRATGNDLDYALLGDGFFAVDRGADEPEYTRNGAFNIGMQGKKGYLVTSDGGYVLDAKGKRITLTAKEDSDVFDLSVVKDKLGVFTFANPYGLQPSSGGSFLKTDISGDAKAVKTTTEMPYEIVEHALESSTVQLADEMVRMIMTQKAFQFSAKVVQTADQVEEIINNLR